MTKFSLNRFCVALLISTICTLTLANTANAAIGPTAAHTRQDATSQYLVRLPTVCDTSQDDYGYKCSVSEIEAVLQPLQAQLTDIHAKYSSLIETNVELLCKPSIDRDWNFDGLVDVGPCLDYSNPSFALYSIFFPCSNPNPRFEQLFPNIYWAGYYDSVDRSNNNYFGCKTNFASDVGLNFKFFQIWRSRWTLIFPNWKSLATEYQRLWDQIEPITWELEKAKSIPSHNPGDCQWRSDPTYGFLAKGKTVVDDYGYKFTCGKSGIRRTGRVSLKAASLSCPEYDSPTGNTCWVRTTWGTSSQLTRLPKYLPNGKVVDTGWFISLTGYQCTVKLYANFAYRETCK